MKNSTNINEQELSKIIGGCSWGGVTRNVIKGGGNWKKTAINVGVYAVTCWW